PNAVDARKGALVLPISRERKEELVAQYVELLGQSNGFAIISGEGISVPKTQQLRKKIYDEGGRYLVAKNTLFRIALEQAGWDIPVEVLKGRTAVAFGMENFPGVAKAVIKFIDDEDLEEKMEVQGGVMGGTDILDGAGVKTVSELPTLPELQAQIIGLLVQPSQNLVNILYNAEAGVVNVLQAWLDKDSDDSGDEDAA
ncbi:MAG: 50S ribosomal protein L10, partial [Chloroflexota bacterium]